METDKLKIILTKIVNSLSGEEITWRLDGSANLLVQEVQTEVKDVDLTTDEKGLDVIRKVLKDFIIQDCYNRDIDAHLIELEIEGTEIEVYHYEDGRSMLDRVKLIKWEGIELPVLPLKDAKEFYEKIKKADKVKLIESNL
jgi:hypothetical protein